MFPMIKSNYQKERYIVMKKKIIIPLIIILLALCLLLILLIKSKINPDTKGTEPSETLNATEEIYSTEDTYSTEIAEATEEIDSNIEETATEEIVVHYITRLEDGTYKYLDNIRQLLKQEHSYFKGANDAEFERELQALAERYFPDGCTDAKELGIVLQVLDDGRASPKDFNRPDYVSRTESTTVADSDTDKKPNQPTDNTSAPDTNNDTDTNTTTPTTTPPDSSNISEKYGYNPGDTFSSYTYIGDDKWLEGDDYYFAHTVEDGFILIREGSIVAKEGETPVSERMGYQIGDVILKTSLGAYQFEYKYAGNDIWYLNDDPNDQYLAYISPEGDFKLGGL